MLLRACTWALAAARRGLATLQKVRLASRPETL